MITKGEINAMFPDCGHNLGYGNTDHDRNRCEGMLEFCRLRKAHRAALELLKTLEELSRRAVLKTKADGSPYDLGASRPQRTRRSSNLE